jgi:hypothetical protein
MTIFMSAPCAVGAKAARGCQCFPHPSDVRGRGHLDVLLRASQSRAHLRQGGSRKPVGLDHKKSAERSRTLTQMGRQRS